jgi:hypothetical protein
VKHAISLDGCRPREWADELDYIFCRARTTFHGIIFQNKRPLFFLVNLIELPRK